jgi:hypothetical protein
LACWRVGGVLVCWCVGVLVCWCVGVLVCWCVGVLVCWLRLIGPDVGTTPTRPQSNDGLATNIHTSGQREHASVPCRTRQCAMQNTPVCHAEIVNMPCRTREYAVHKDGVPAERQQQAQPTWCEEDRRLTYPIDSLHSPKSVILMCPSRSSIRFSSLRSR